MQLTNYLNPEILQSLYYSNIEEAGLDMLMLSAQAKYSEYLTENRQFEKKYQTDFFSFQKMNNQQIDEEDFEQEDDLMAWRFAYENFQYWKEKTEADYNGFRGGSRTCPQTDPAERAGLSFVPRV